MEITNICIKCKIEKPHFLFPKKKNTCKDCISAKYRKNTNPAIARNNNLRNRYGITSLEYDQMYLEQNGLCLICNQPEKLYVDHCHENKNIRGLLCHKCNLGIGYFKDNIDSLKNAIKYLRKANGKKK